MAQQAETTQLRVPTLVGTAGGIPGFGAKGFASGQMSEQPAWAVTPSGGASPGTPSAGEHPSDPPTVKLEKLLATDFVETHLAGLAEPLRLAFCKALGMEPGEAATTEIIMTISADETQKMLQSAEVDTVNDNGATEARGIKGIEVAVPHGADTPPR